MTEPQREQFWQEARAVGVRLGIPISLSPADWSALMGYWQRMLADDGPIHVTSHRAAHLARLIVRPPIPLLPGPIVDLLALPGLGLLPARLRREFGINWGRRREFAAARAWAGDQPMGSGGAAPPAPDAARPRVPTGG